MCYENGYPASSLTARGPKRIIASDNGTLSVATFRIVATPKFPSNPLKFRGRGWDDRWDIGRPGKGAGGSIMNHPLYVYQRWIIAAHTHGRCWWEGVVSDVLCYGLLEKGWLVPGYFRLGKAGVWIRRWSRSEPFRDGLFWERVWATRKARNPGCQLMACQQS